MSGVLAGNLILTKQWVFCLSKILCLSSSMKLGHGVHSNVSACQLRIHLSSNNKYKKKQQVPQAVFKEILKGWKAVMWLFLPGGPIDTWQELFYEVDYIIKGCYWPNDQGTNVKAHWDGYCDNTLHKNLLWLLLLLLLLSASMKKKYLHNYAVQKQSYQLQLLHGFFQLVTGNLILASEI